MTKITTDLTTHQTGIDMNGVQRLFADKAARDEINTHDTRIDTVQSNVTTETSRATAAEQQLQTNLSAEVTRATAAESTNATNISANTAAINAEASRAKGIEEGITTRVTTLETDHTSMKPQLDVLLEVTAHAIAELQAEIDGLKERVNEGFGNIKAQNLDLENLPQVVATDFYSQGSGAPSFTPMFIGQEYMDTDTGTLYKCYQVTASTNDWKSTK